MASKSSVTVKKTKRGVSIEFKNLNMKPEELHKIIEESKKGAITNGKTTDNSAG